jgi:hypothetical protein
MLKVSRDDKSEAAQAVDPAVLKRQRRLVELRADLQRAQQQHAQVKRSGLRDHGTEQRLLDLAAWIERVESELKILEGVK